VLADLMTIREKMTRLEGLKLCFIGDGNNMANSLIVGGLKCGMDVSVACPAGYDPDPGCWTLPDRHRRRVCPVPRPEAGPKTPT
jgi:ornithine carbamoyltransferase